MSSIRVLLLLCAVNTLYQELAAADCGDPSPQWSFQWENDSFPGASRSGSDRFYTNGLRVNHSKTGEGVTFLRTILESVWFRAESTSGVFCSKEGWRIGHQFYTPQTITSTELDVRDRPYAGMLYGAVNVTQGSRLGLEGQPLVVRSAELQIGLIGPAAHAETIQSAWHSLSIIDAPEPLGWHHQLPNEVVANINLTAARRFPFNAHFDAVPQLDIGIGTIFVGARTRATFRFGNHLGGFPYERIEPSAPQFGLRTAADADARYLRDDPGLIWWIYVGFEAEVVARDAFLDGTLFKSSHRVDTRPLRTVRTAGIHAELEGIGVDLMWVNHSKEFDTQATGIDRHEYLSINFTWIPGG